MPSVIQCQIKLKLTARQERELERWLRHLASIWNWSVKKIENDGRDGIYYTPKAFQNILNGHSKKLGIPSDAIGGTLITAHTAWHRCFNGLSRKPRFKGRRNRLNSIAFAHGAKIKDGRVIVPFLGRVRFHKQNVPDGCIGQFRLVKRESGWYACLFIQAEPKAIERTGEGRIGIDPGFNSLLTLSTGEQIDHPQELQVSANRLAQAQRGNDKHLTARLQEKIANQRKDRNHKLSRRLVSENILIAFSKDNIKGISKRFGKSVASSGHGQLRSMLSYKASRTGDTIYVEPGSKKSTITCSTCGAETGPRGLAGLSVRAWGCLACGSQHDRDINAAVNTLKSALGASVETPAKVA